MKCAACGRGFRYLTGSIALVVLVGCGGSADPPAAAPPVAADAFPAGTESAAADHSGVSPANDDPWEAVLTGLFAVQSEQVEILAAVQTAGDIPAAEVRLDRLAARLDGLIEQARQAPRLDADDFAARMARHRPRGEQLAGQFLRELTRLSNQGDEGLSTWAQASIERFGRKSAALAELLPDAGQ